MYFFAFSPHQRRSAGFSSAVPLGHRRNRNASFSGHRNYLAYTHSRAERSGSLWVGERPETESSGSRFQALGFPREQEVDCIVWRSGGALPLLQYPLFSLRLVQKKLWCGGLYLFFTVLAREDELSSVEGL